MCVEAASRSPPSQVLHPRHARLTTRCITYSVHVETLTQSHEYRSARLLRHIFCLFFLRGLFFLVHFVWGGPCWVCLLSRGQSRQLERLVLIPGVSLDSFATALRFESAGRTGSCIQCAVGRCCGLLCSLVKGETRCGRCEKEKECMCSLSTLFLVVEQTWLPDAL